MFLVKSDFAAQYAAGADPYYEGDALRAGDIVTPRRPDSSYEWNGAAWAQNAAKAQALADAAAAQSERASAKADAQIQAFLALTPAARDSAIDAAFSGAAAVVIKRLTRIIAAIAKSQL